MAEEVGYREVLIAPLEARREAIGLLGVIVLIALLMALRFSLLTGTTPQQGLKAYQRPDTVLTGQQPLLYRTLLSVVDEVVDLRDQEGEWPAVKVLEREHIPPFDKSFLPVALKSYVWSRHEGNSWVDYFGENPKRADADAVAHEPTSFLLRIIDLHTENHPHPHPGIDYDPNMRFAAQVWTYPAKRPYPGERVVEFGWKWIVGPSDRSLWANQEISEAPGAKKP
ncbi:MAG: hypothetical protein SWH78_01555 [Thermodesulfobacteriota bacterium]|nr:hypothetical protein [Thermodesulfobacteriota bacterium]